jgi:hypothetical protein
MARKVSSSWLSTVIVDGNCWVWEKSLVRILLGATRHENQLETLMRFEERTQQRGGGRDF